MRLGLIFDFHSQITVCGSTEIKFLLKFGGKVGGSHPFLLPNFIIIFQWSVPNFVLADGGVWQLYNLQLLRIGPNNYTFVYELILAIFNTKLLEYKTNILTKFGFPEALSGFQQKGGLIGRTIDRQIDRKTDGQTNFGCPENLAFNRKAISPPFY